MKIVLAIPAEDPSGLGALRSSTITKAPYFAIVQLEAIGGMFLEGVKNTGSNDAEIIELLSAHGVDTVLTIGVGVDQALAFGEAGISVYRETETKTVGDAGKAFEYSMHQAMLQD